jgi:molybdopterin-binding protein
VNVDYVTVPVGADGAAGEDGKADRSHLIEVAPGVRVGSVITTDSVDRLGLAVGGRAVAVIKATEVMVGIE